MKRIDRQSRRWMLQRVVGVGALALSARWGSALASLKPTPSQTRGPFYPDPLPLETDGDLTMLEGAKGRASGQVIHVAGRVLDKAGKPVRGATIEIWQANTHGRYAHPRDINPAPLDPNFQGYAKIATDADGRYRFKTIKPGAYPMNPANPDNVRPPHIHFEIHGGGEDLVTQMYFPGEKLNDGDGIFARLGDDKASTIAKALDGADGVASGELAYGWDIVLA